MNEPAYLKLYTLTPTARRKEQARIQTYKKHLRELITSINTQKLEPVHTHTENEIKNGPPLHTFFTCLDELTRQNPPQAKPILLLFADLELLRANLSTKNAYTLDKTRQWTTPYQTEIRALTYKLSPIFQKEPDTPQF